MSLAKFSIFHFGQCCLHYVRVHVWWVWYLDTRLFFYWSFYGDIQQLLPDCWAFRLKVSIRSAADAPHPKRTASAFRDALAVGRLPEAGLQLWKAGLFPFFLDPEGSLLRSQLKPESCWFLQAQASEASQPLSPTCFRVGSCLKRKRQRRRRAPFLSVLFWGSWLLCSGTLGGPELLCLSLATWDSRRRCQASLLFSHQFLFSFSASYTVANLEFLEGK